MFFEPFWQSACCNQLGNGRPPIGRYRAAFDFNRGENDA